MTPIAVKKTIPLLDLAALHAPMRAELLAEMTRVVDSQKFIMGEDVKELEKLMADYSGVRYAVGCASGSDALYLALAAAGIQSGDRVLTTSYSFFATAGAITRTGAIPVFADIDPLTYNINPDQVSEALSRDARIKAVIPVHLFGACADMDPIMEAARKHGCSVIEDGAQAIGAEYKGRKAQSIGDSGCISFFPSKNLGCFGDGGMVMTSDDALAKTLAALRVHGSLKKYYHEMVGINSRLDTLQAAVLKVKFQYLDSWTAARQRNANLYRQILQELAPSIVVPQDAPYQTRHVYNQFVIRSAERDRLKSWLQDNGIGTEVYYPLPLHLQPCYQQLGYIEGSLPESEKAAKESLALPVHSGLSSEDIEYVCQIIADFSSNDRGRA
jgi:dTDP-4-amino-4,6-dideoxygalactose transaminase